MTKRDVFWIRFVGFVVGVMLCGWVCWDSIVVGILMMLCYVLCVQEWVPAKKGKDDDYSGPEAFV